MSQVHPLLEKVARAMAPQAWCIGYSQTERDWSIAKARAAVRALMEPDEDLLADGAAEAGTSSRAMRHGFRAMLLPLVEGEG